MSGSRIHQVCSSQLFDVSESLELRSINDLHQQMRQLNLTMNGVVEDLQDRKQDNTCTDIDIAIQKFGNALGRGALDNIRTFLEFSRKSILELMCSVLFTLTLSPIQIIILFNLNFYLA